MKSAERGERCQVKIWVFLLSDIHFLQSPSPWLSARYCQVECSSSNLELEINPVSCLNWVKILKIWTNLSYYLSCFLPGSQAGNFYPWLSSATMIHYDGGPSLQHSFTGKIICCNKTWPHSSPPTQLVFNISVLEYNRIGRREWGDSSSLKELLLNLETVTLFAWLKFMGCLGRV